MSYFCCILHGSPPVHLARCGCLRRSTKRIRTSSTKNSTSKSGWVILHVVSMQIRCPSFHCLFWGAAVRLIPTITITNSERREESFHFNSQVVHGMVYIHDEGETRDAYAVRYTTRHASSVGQMQCREREQRAMRASERPISICPSSEARLPSPLLCREPMNSILRSIHLSWRECGKVRTFFARFLRSFRSLRVGFSTFFARPDCAFR